MTANQNPQFSKWLKSTIESSDNPLVREAEAAANALFNIDSLIPPKYGWKVIDLDFFNSLVERAKSTEEINRLYWHDMARSIEAYNLMVVMRGAELARATIFSLNRKEVIPPAILSRSLLELATTVILNTNALYKTIEELCKIKGTDKAIVSEDLEKLILRMLYGTRIGEPSEHLKQTNILTHLQKLSKNPNATDLLKTYEILCDVAHPNNLGNARFWAGDSPQNEDGSKISVLERNAEFAPSLLIRENSLWALAWSCSCVANGFQIGQSSVKLIFQRWPLK